MVDAQRALLDELMGKHRNLPADQRPAAALKWSDPQVCMWYNLGFCPHDLFVNTKSDLGPCDKEHDDKLRMDFEVETSDNPKLLMLHERKYMAYLEKLLYDVDRRIRSHNDRLKTELKIDLDPDVQKQVDEIGRQIASLVQQMETLGESGQVDESQALMKLVDSLRVKKAELERPSATVIEAMAPSRRGQMVCEICGAILVQNDAESRVTSHLEGKMHVGYKRIRDYIAKIKAKLEKIDPAPVSGYGPRPGSPSGTARPGSPRRRSPPRRRSRSPPRRRSRSPRRDERDYRDRDRDYRRRSRSRSRSRDRDRRRR